MQLSVRMPAPFLSSGSQTGSQTNDVLPMRWVGYSAILSRRRHTAGSQTPVTAAQSITIDESEAVVPCELRGEGDPPLAVPPRSPRGLRGSHSNEVRYVGHIA